MEKCENMMKMRLYHAFIVILFILEENLRKS